MPRSEGLHGPDEKRPSGPQADGGGERQPNPASRSHGQAGEHAAAGHDLGHPQHEERDTEHGGDPEPPRHVGRLGILAVIERHGLRLERHAANRTGAGPRLHNLGVHGAGERCGGSGVLGFWGSEVLRFWGAGVLGCWGPEPFCRVRRELVLAAGAAEVIRRPLVFVRVFRGRRIDRHAADGIESLGIAGCRVSHQDHRPCYRPSCRASDWRLEQACVGVRPVAMAIG